MATFRAYVLNEAGRIAQGEWIEAATQEEALTKARELRRDDSASIELWLGAKKLGQAPCRNEP